MNKIEKYDIEKNKMGNIVKMDAKKAEEKDRVNQKVRGKKNG